MTITSDKSFHIQHGSLQFSFCESGDIRNMTYNGLMINQWLANSIDGALNNLYLRLHEPSGIRALPLLGVHSASLVGFSDQQAVWQGSVEALQYKVVLTLASDGIWFWDVTVDGQGQEVDLVYGQDVGIASLGFIRNNEAYLSQYIDHAVFEDEQKGYVVCSRQNQRQPGGFPYLQQGALTGAAGFSTDGFQFFGLSYKETNVPEALKHDKLRNEVYQYEFAYTALQSERAVLDGKARFVFYGLFQEDHPKAITELEHGMMISEAWEQVSKLPEPSVRQAAKVSRNALIGAPLESESMTAEEIAQYFPQRIQEEKDGETLLSFFTNSYEHVVLKEKELRVERPHGHILMTGQNERMKENVLTTTSYMYGIFNSQLTVGNTSFNKMLTNARSALNVMKTSGQRIYIEVNGAYRLLTLPSLFELGFNYVSWYYKTADDTIIITNFTAVDTPELCLQVRSTKGRSYRYMVTNQVSMNNSEYEAPFHMEQQGDVLAFRADASSNSAAILPELSYRMKLAGTGMKVTDETVLAANLSVPSASLVVLELDACREWTLTVQGLLRGEELPFQTLDAASEISRYREFFREVMRGFRLSQQEGGKENLEKINALAWWYTHNMLVHYSVPHGLEQFGGAAWGTRDVCQGPVEYFLATQQYESVREILLTVYTHQFEDDGNWPQWFMFDEYAHIYASESHGDIIVWPLKALNDYLHATQDFRLLEETIPYTSRDNGKVTETPSRLFDHMKRAVEYIKDNFLHDTHLSAYGDGDWDDTLQPARKELKKFMASSWTVALTYQVFSQSSKVMAAYDGAFASELKELAEGIQADFNRYMLNTGTIPGFVYMEEPGQAELMLHPTDTSTGIQYRLLPMTRSMIGELLTKEQADSHHELIKRELYCPDGVRLMNRPANYEGGVSTHFQRAEQASNFGREVGLQYVHAHIRFVEAMAKLGKADEAWKGLAMINPIGIQDVVPNAEIRQSNTYFSSSDGKFNTRYEAQDRFQELRNGSVPVKGGWRIYSSGPGIYMNQLISNCLGIRRENGDLVIDPVLPRELNGMQFDYTFAGRPVRFVYRLGEGQSIQRITVNGQEAAYEETANRYRQGGVRVKRELLDGLQPDGVNVIEIYM
ncbi:GH36-type glycosyl hydrolase domain-containing protein [Paenibacillus spongiae]|uniref:Cellobiose phosphorylase n=1 Tax=Paenibacillus spongiae TaxID=2909671 RepID=A0ABY5SBP8_9BACL|nr:amylo-alpha-1,6-glucosidase [Paenibacillus spongiae]UVI30950.1 cellobiose phosphorylase [Paenibacillus spongiae]